MNWIYYVLSEDAASLQGPGWTVSPAMPPVQKVLEKLQKFVARGHQSIPNYPAYAICVLAFSCYGEFQLFESKVSPPLSTITHSGLSPLSNLPASLLPKLPNLEPSPEPKSAARPAAPVAAKPTMGAPIPMAPVEHVQLFKVKHVCQEKWHTEPVSQ